MTTIERYIERCEHKNLVKKFYKDLQTKQGWDLEFTHQATFADSEKDDIKSEIYGLVSKFYSDMSEVHDQVWFIGKKVILAITKY